MKNSSNLKKIVPIALGIIVFVVAFFATQHFLSSDSAPTKETLASAAKKISTNYPLVLDNGSRVDNVSYSFETNTFQYNYILTDITLSDIAGNTDPLRETFKADVLETLRNNAELEVFKKSETTFIHYYYDKDGNSLFDITVTPDLYK